MVSFKSGALPFLCDLVSEDGLGPQEHLCSFVPGTVVLTEQSGFTYRQQARLEVRPLATDAVADQAVIDAAAAILVAGGRLTGPLS